MGPKVGQKLTGYWAIGQVCDFVREKIEQPKKAEKKQKKKLATEKCYPAIRVSELKPSLRE